MSQRKPDRRVRRTRSALRDALLALILEKGYDAVTIEDITERADLGRTTFYLHYKDKEDLLGQSLEAVFDGLVAQIQAQPLQAWWQSGNAPIASAFQHAADNADLYRILLSGQGGTAVSRRVHEYIAARAHTMIELIIAEHDVQFAVPLEVTANYIAGSMLGLITWWLEQDMPYPPAEMVRYFRQLNFFGTVRLVDGDFPLSPEMDLPSESV